MKLTRLNELIEDGKKVKGRWVLTPGHELQYKSEGKNEEIKLKGSLVAAEPDALIFSVTERQNDQRIVTSLVKLSGEWKLNPENQILFEVEKETGRNDTLTLTGGWKVGESHELVYRWEETRLKTKKRQIRTLVFRGFWELSEKNRLTYYLGADSGSALKVRGAFQTHSILAKDGEIRYQIGVEAAARKNAQVIVLFGKWKISRDLGLLFEIEYANGSKKAIRFGGEYSLDEDKTVRVDLQTRPGEPIGVELVITKDFLGGEAFLRVLKSLEESRVEAGVRFNW